MARTAEPFPPLHRDTPRGREPPLLRWTSWCLEARQIVEALHIPFSQRILLFSPLVPVSRGTWSHIIQGDLTNLVLLWNELPPRMLLVDVGFYFGPYHLIMASLIHFEDKVHRRSSRGSTPFHYYSRDCCARSWSIWDFLLSLGSSATAFVESDSLSTNGISWWAILHSRVPPMVAPPCLQTRAGRAPGRDCTTSARTSGYFCCPAYDFYYSTSRPTTSSLYHHIGFGVSPGLLPPPQLPFRILKAYSSAEDTTLAKVHIPPPQDEPPIVTATPEDASSPPEAPLLIIGHSLSYCIYMLYYWRFVLVLILYILDWMYY
ncbi:hypothetical protein CK203_051868 [Vitis vinifera]|uniref:Uncharacterized protein n=1 Tax=Vitis vinifera TaxID=29760 RepID=A0A438HAQ2_VITVI|nr:hypothetical protein CK203_051868 [Vitis vinifera]